MSKHISLGKKQHKICCKYHENVMDLQRKKIEQLQAELEEWRNNEGSVCPENVGFVEYIKALRAENERLRENLELYGGHSETCGKLPLNAKCICGFNQALSEQR